MCGVELDLPVFEGRLGECLRREAGDHIWTQNPECWTELGLSIPVEWMK